MKRAQRAKCTKEKGLDRGRLDRVKRTKVKMTIASGILYLKVYEPKMTFSKQTLHLGQVISLKSPHDLEIQYDKLGVEK